MPKISCGRADELVPGMSRRIEAKREAIAVFNIGGAFYACDDTCPHAGASLHDGHVEGTTVSCLWHGWAFDLAEGPGAPRDGVRRFPVSVEGGELYIQVPD